MIYESLYHIYVNDKCVKHNLQESEFRKEIQFIRAFLELTDLDNDAIVDYVRCDPPQESLVDGSY